MSPFSIEVNGGEFIVKILRGREEKVQAFALRHEIFCRTLKWVPEDFSLLERDEYDAHAIPFGVMNRERKLLGYLRLIPAKNDFMLQKEFSNLLGPNESIRHADDTAEISRLCIVRESRSQGIQDTCGTYGTAMLLYKGVYQYCSKKGIRYLYLVMENKGLRLLQIRGFPCRAIGAPVMMPDGVTAVAAELDWREFEEVNWMKRKELLTWFRSTQSARIVRRLPPVESGSRLRVSP